MMAGPSMRSPADERVALVDAGIDEVAARRRSNTGAAVAGCTVRVAPTGSTAVASGSGDRLAFTDQVTISISSRQPVDRPAEEARIVLFGSAVGASRASSGSKRRIGQRHGNLPALPGIAHEGRELDDRLGAAQLAGDEA